MSKLDLLPYASRLKRKIEDDKVFFWDPIRKKYLVLSPEELVRQCIILYVLEEKLISKNRISIERQVPGTSKDLRFDILFYNAEAKPIMLVECKAPSVPLTQLTFDQISHYNASLKVPFLWICNGPDSIFVSINWMQKKFKILDKFPADEMHKIS